MSKGVIKLIRLMLLFKVSNNKMTRIEVMAIIVDADGNDEDIFGGETGSPEFYMVKDTLQQHLGENNQLLFYNHESKDTFIIETKEGENKNRINQYIDTIKNIYKPFAPGFIDYYKDRRLRFNIIRVE
jgi:hypothetical protein